jgi:hypothetical protein
MITNIQIIYARSLSLALACMVCLIGGLCLADDFDPYETSITEIHEAMVAGEVTARQLVEYYLASRSIQMRSSAQMNWTRLIGAMA